MENRCPVVTMLMSLMMTLITMTKKMTRFQALPGAGTNYLCGSFFCYQLRTCVLKVGVRKEFFGKCLFWDVLLSSISLCTNTMPQSHGIQNSDESLIEIGLRSWSMGNGYHNNLKPHLSLQSVISTISVLWTIQTNNLRPCPRGAHCLTSER